MNIFAKERQSNQYDASMRDSHQAGITADPGKYAARPNKENGIQLKSRKSRHFDEMDEAQKIIERKMQQLDVIEDSRMGKDKDYESGSEDDDEESGSEDSEAQEVQPKNGK
mmetsp:Transcript_15270/g.20751  ORF Transcript_15270/g.20751 Transcript_15270/m.20751 type:complete len:111 (-) Transcript_15270:1129-1461(-)|eukprot:CAMPEP_0185568126 /NCGR_PEP_ID=MMETSP0434-20130131/1185_1 /TAXON_ID=626734 ORGANISM="Favella taraikaensis, Strain Fe Narragansett Bay" /NCGR_SAMPLE_ID=MMETSP0434 /ASSEMBLY_ACC=CAM_ASM_000379 /LENGTH=110 /DNA_ID=CAMNT_0028182541 /DNA_START=1815 /DNA_END=2147 /DNA_ORIENTATION=-